MSATMPSLPALPYDEWEETKATVHLATQIMGKVKLARHPKQSHWWHATLQVTPRGVSTRTIPVSGGAFEIELDVHDLRWIVSASDGRQAGFDLAGLSIADVYNRAMETLETLGHGTSILGRPYDNPHSDTPFVEDTQKRDWDHGAIVAWWQTLLFADECFKVFVGRSFMRTSPVHLFWHSFDLAVTRFTARRSPSFGAGNRRSDVEAYSHELISFGYWPGDPDVRYPAFYSYTAPEPDGIADHPLTPQSAWWQELPASHMALLRYDDVRRAKDPRSTLLSFMESAYEAGSTSLGLHSSAEDTGPHWDRLDTQFPLTRGTESR